MSDVESDYDVFVDMAVAAIKHFRETSNPSPVFFSEEEKKKVLWSDRVKGPENFTSQPVLTQALQ
jgi:hypothetical protein